MCAAKCDLQSPTTVMGKPRAPMSEKHTLKEPVCALQSMAPFPAASAASICSRPRISIRGASARPFPARRITSTASQERREVIASDLPPLCRTQLIAQDSREIVNNAGAQRGVQAAAPVTTQAGDTIGQRRGQESDQRHDEQAIEKLFEPTQKPLACRSRVPLPL